MASLIKRGNRYYVRLYVNGKRKEKRHPRFHMHFIPTSSSWLNLIERWFREITDKQIRRGSFTSVPQLIESITEFIDAHNAEPRPFVWTAGVQQILDKVRRARATLDKVRSG